MPSECTHRTFDVGLFQNHDSVVDRIANETMESKGKERKSEKGDLQVVGKGEMSKILWRRPSILDLLSYGSVSAGRREA